MRISRWNSQHDWPLWVRAAERIDVPTGGVVPGPRDIAPPAAPSTAPGAPLAEGWLGWWRAVLGLPRPPITIPDDVSDADLPDFVSLGPPAFNGLAEWPALREVAARRWREADEWHQARKDAGLRTFHSTEPDHSGLVAEVERSLGRRAAPFEVEFILLPVRDDKVRPIDGTRFLVPERLYDGPAWFEWLRPVLTRLAAG